MHLYIDIGNSNIVIGKGNKTLQETTRYTTELNKSSDEYYTMLKHLFTDVTHVFIASVVPQLNTTFRTFIRDYFKLVPMFIGPGVKTGVKIKTDNPKEVGADLVAGAAGAMKQYGNDAIIVDMGTATTFTVLKNKEIIGVAITVGLDSGRDCLVRKASKLLQFEFEAPKDLLGTNTVDALNSGLIFGHVFQIIGMVRNLLPRFENKETPVIITGGASKLLHTLLPKSYHYDEFLVLEGLVYIADKNL